MTRDTYDSDDIPRILAGIEGRAFAIADSLARIATALERLAPAPVAPAPVEPPGTAVCPHCHKPFGECECPF